jgi:hypothetical protein
MFYFKFINPLLMLLAVAVAGLGLSQAVYAGKPQQPYPSPLQVTHTSKVQKDIYK